jgi:hypothetical protein
MAYPKKYVSEELENMMNRSDSDVSESGFLKKVIRIVVLIMQTVR